MGARHARLPGRSGDESRPILGVVGNGTSPSSHMPQPREPSALARFCDNINKTMARLKRKGKTTTVSVSVSAATKARLRKAADRAYGGNVSALIEAIALEADKQGALDWLLHRAPPIDDQAFDAFMDEMSGRKKRRVA